MAGNVRMISEAVETPQEVPTQVTPEELAAAFERLEQMGRDGIVQPPAPTAPKVVVKRALPDREILAVMGGLGAVLVVRLMLLMAVLGAGFLAYMAIEKASAIALAVMVSYALTIVMPLVWLSTKRT